MSKTVIITGASAGIGRACSLLLAKSFSKMIITGRRKSVLEELAREIESKNDLEVIVADFDLSKYAQCRQFIDKFKAELTELTTLINNAGLASGIEPIDEANIEDWDQMIDTNVKGLFYMTRLCLPFLKKSLSSHIVNISSVAGQWVYPGGGVYCSTKHAVSAFSQGLRLDLNGQGIRVTNICPGMVETEFSKVRLGSDEKAKQFYEGMTPLKAEDIAETVRWSLQQPLHVNIQEITVFPTDQASVGLVHRA